MSKSTSEASNAESARTPTGERDWSATPELGAPMRDPSGKVAFITGGASGIGRGIASAFVRAGMRVVIGDCNLQHLDETVNFLKQMVGDVHPIQVDVTDRRGMENAATETIKTFGKVHVLVNNAGVITGTPLDRATYDDWDWVLSVNLTGVFNGLRAFLPHIMSHGQGGQIVTTASVNGLVAIGGSLGIYSTSKFAVVGMMEALRGDLSGIGIGVSIFCPGYVKSHLGDAARNRPAKFSDTADKPLDPQIRETLRAKLASAEELAMDPLEAGQLVLRGMQNNDLYILSHPEFEQGIRDRNEALIASIPNDLYPAEARVKAERTILRNTIYMAERDRKRRGRDCP